MNSHPSSEHRRPPIAFRGVVHFGFTAAALAAHACGGGSGPPGEGVDAAVGGNGGANVTAALGGSSSSATSSGSVSTNATAMGGTNSAGGKSAPVSAGAAESGGNQSRGGALTGASGMGDAGTTVASGATDAGGSGCDAYVMPADCSIPEGLVLPSELRCTGLYADWDSRELRCGVRPYVPAYQLWADNAGKQRYVSLPPGASIDVSDPDSFVFPIGTRFWKEFYVGAEGKQRLGETRFLTKVKGGWLYTTYVWSEDGKQALQNNGGVENLFGTGHSVPTRDQCKTCHSGRPDYVLGWDTIMLGDLATGTTLRELAKNGELSGLEPRLLEVTIPGDAIEQAALGYLHANCGVSCHNQTTDATGNPSGLFLRLELAELGSVMTTDAARSGINRLPSPNADYRDLPPANVDFYDFRPRDAKRSLSLARMQYRGSVTAMPPIGTHQIHPEGVVAVRAWIESMTPERGYPAPAP